MTELSCGFWNLDNNRYDHLVLAEVEAFIKAHDLDVFLYCEGQEYADDLRLIPGYDLWTTRKKSPSERDAGIMVRHGLRTKGYRLTRARIGWPRTKGPGIHWPRSFPSVKVEGIRFWSVHFPPNPDKPGNRLAYAEAWTLLAVALARRAGPFCAPGDYNRRTDTRGAWTPRTLARVVRGYLTGRRIDHVLARGVHVDQLLTVAHGTSDHQPIKFRLRRPSR